MNFLVSTFEMYVGRSISRRLSISFHDRAKSGVESPSYMDTFAKTLFPSIEERAEIIHDDEMRSQSRLTCRLDDDELLDGRGKFLPLSSPSPLFFFVSFEY